MFVTHDPNPFQDTNEADLSVSFPLFFSPSPFPSPSPCVCVCLCARARSETQEGCFSRSVLSASAKQCFQGSPCTLYPVYMVFTGLSAHGLQTGNLAFEGLGWVWGQLAGWLLLGSRQDCVSLTHRIAVHGRSVTSCRSSGLPHQPPSLHPTSLACGFVISNPLPETVISSR